MKFKAPSEKLAGRLLNAGIAVVAALVITVIALGVWFEEGGDRGAKEGPRVGIGGPFTLTDQHGRTVADTAFPGRLLLVYFGYTFCPDVCPADLLGVSEAVAEVNDKRVQPIFITIDPVRDTVEILGAYARHFHPDLIALTGTPEQIAAVANQYGVYFRKAGETDDSEDYLMDHTGQVYLMGAGGEFLTRFSHGTAPDVMASTIRRFL